MSERIDELVGVVQQRRPQLLLLVDEVLADLKNAQPIFRDQVRIAPVSRRETLGKACQLRSFPVDLLVLNRAQALSDALALVGGLDGLTCQRIVGAGLYGAIQEDMGLQDEVIVGRCIRQRCRKRELCKDQISPVRQGRSVYRLSILVSKGTEALSGCLNELATSLILLACFYELESDRCLPECLHFLNPFRIGPPSRWHLHEIAPTRLRRVGKVQANEFLRERKVEFVGVCEVPPLQNGRFD